MDINNEAKRVSKIVAHEIEILMLYVVLYVIADFILIYLDWHDSMIRDVIFYGVIFLSIIHDLSTGPVVIDVPVLQGKVIAMAQMALVMACVVLVLACVSTQFLVPVDVEVIPDEEDDDEDEEGNGEIMTVWKIAYAGFNPKSHNGKKELLLSLEGISSDGQNQTGTTSTDIEPVSIRALIHIVVDGTKVLIVRLLLCEGELILKMLFTFYTKI